MIHLQCCIEDEFQFVIQQGYEISRKESTIFLGKSDKLLMKLLQMLPQQLLVN